MTRCVTEFTNSEAQTLVGRVLAVNGEPYTVTGVSTHGRVTVFDPTRHEWLQFDSRETFENWAYGTPIKSN